MPRYHNATWAGKTRVLENDFVRIEVHNRKTGWAFVEFYTKKGKLMGVLPYLVGVQENEGGPRGNLASFRRIESQEVKEEHTAEADALIFDVHALTFGEYTKDSFVEFLTPPEIPLPNALMPVITGLGGALTRIVAGSAVIEAVFSVPGVGQYMLVCINGLDFPGVRACVLFFAAFSSFIMILVDLVYGFIDPRIKAQYASRGGRK